MLLDNSNISRAMPGSRRISPRLTFQSRNSYTSAFSDGTMPTGDLRRLAQVRAVERNRRNRPTSQSLLGFLAQALEETIFHHIAHSATVSFTIDLFDPPGRRESPWRMQFPGRRGAYPANRLWRHPRGLPRAAHRLPVMFLLPWLTPTPPDSEHEPSSGLPGVSAQSGLRCPQE